MRQFKGYTGKVRFTKQIGSLGNCIQAQVFQEDGNYLASFRGTFLEEVANANAELLADALTTIEKSDMMPSLVYNNLNQAMADNKVILQEWENISKQNKEMKLVFEELLVKMEEETHQNKIIGRGTNWTTQIEQIKSIINQENA